ncbi:hypothetical protein PPERSA_00654 [Pseudocohnilembus persalinus]|uniref:Uncharacterized protein n=1 Tax=Pseudocohnilembus persalinus TaxID=266149 RepID=A0A0V0QSN1_PSEPJ|nr:hypothetical protein PPERSA_00654 [Pseudocohnilembus persalinus]|eukprot:KRX05353.1 hypothetical protein PPERSA_00654 [Pseudocohnilembus persalinus]
MYNQKLSKDSLEISLIRFGEDDLFKYGLGRYVVPIYKRINYPIILGFKSNDQSLNFRDELDGELRVKSQKDQKARDNNNDNSIRYFHVNNKDGNNDYLYLNQNKKFEPEILQNDVIYFDTQEIVLHQQTKELAQINYEELREFKIDTSQISQQEQQILLQNKKLTKKLQEQPENLENWINILEFQDKNANLSQNYKSLGYKEQSLGIIQALNELNIFCPQNMKYLEYSEKLQKFSEYWNSYQDAKTGEIEIYNGWEDHQTYQYQQIPNFPPHTRQSNKLSTIQTKITTNQTVQQKQNALQTFNNCLIQYGLS